MRLGGAGYRAFAHEVLESRCAPEDGAAILGWMFRIVFVCTGNRFRSPIAAALLRRLLASLPVDVESAGVIELGPLPPLPEAVHHARSLGLDLSHHKARPLSQADVATADLVIGFEHDHVAAAVVDGGTPPERAFTLVELVSLLEEEPRELPEDLLARVRARLALAHVQRAPGLPVGVGLPDPLGGTASDFAGVASRLRELCAALAAALFDA